MLAFFVCCFSVCSLWYRQDFLTRIISPKLYEICGRYSHPILFLKVYKCFQMQLQLPKTMVLAGVDEENAFILMQTA